MFPGQVHRFVRWLLHRLHAFSTMGQRIGPVGARRNARDR
ncbi:hypothetical protein ATSB10_38250 [Dyella thiooxydans]|uniref:Uncharacterized protein n=1 Tax=Dyella thiooxydans TaxID=445710 RepID=A0A161J2T6_9GAMM|nr:hypothetical protein ATSB10_38250 [Dyella thiooxydans]